MTDHPGKAALAAIMEAAGKVADVNADYNEFDGDRRGIYAALVAARKKLSFVVAQESLVANAVTYVASLEAERDAAKAENERLREALGLNDEDAMIDEIEEAISESFDIDWKARDGAKHVVDLLRTRAALGGDNG